MDIKFASTGSNAITFNGLIFNALTTGISWVVPFLPSDKLNYITSLTYTNISLNALIDT